jgi:predicted nucleic acid-binding protein
MDAGGLQIAAVARSKNLAVVTRNVQHFGRVPGLEVVEPSAEVAARCSR